MLATDRPDESTKQHVKDNNFRGIGIFRDANGVPNLYVSKGSGGNGDDGIFQVEAGTADGLPVGTGNTIIQLIGTQATNPGTGASSPLTPFGFFFANPTTLYVADEGNATIGTDAQGNPDPRLRPAGRPTEMVARRTRSGNLNTCSKTGSTST